ncbi:5-formyltetrahydrofolate cyclo-ligase [Tissierella sp. MSJ-40]|uniref:5-formyltetrahydrofolate cyclo-ligase n=1 Tax=Tissierella simiarum TaxID=2841534 RepID=A0ABS6E6T2_9FIRM|nr:5-formyltetrahydrofolate cyclo-ligase [Tissierella simiarum]MBU5438492.1 5-formyltetrahydrofolate cyclo-ligase [Tissierella simiarum]
MDKKALRKELLIKRENLTEKEILKKSNLITNSIYNSKVYRDAKTIMTYISFKNEVYTHNIIKKSIIENKKIVVPITIPETKELKISQVLDFSELEIGYYNILTPKKEFLRYIDPKDIDLVLVPGVAFDKNGYRIGYGGGYYDRFLDKLRKDAIKIGLAFDLQLIDKVPKDNYDKPVDIIITENEIINCSGKI